MADWNGVVRRGGRLLAGCLLAGALAAGAEPGGPYLGVAGAADMQQFTYDKSVYTPEGLASGEVTMNDDTAKDTLWTVGVFTGYRWPVGASGLRLAAEIDLMAHPQRLEGHLEGTGYTWTDTWPEDWWLDRDLSYGITLRLGGPFPGSRFGWHVLAGLKRAQTEFSITETGCPGADLQCPPTPLASFTEAVERDFNARVFGAGIAHPLTDVLSLELEVRRTEYDRKAWDRLFEGGAVIIPSALEGHDTTATLRLVWRPRGA